MKWLFTSAAVFSLAHAAIGGTTIDIKVARDPGGPWVDYLADTPGASVHVAVFVGFSQGLGLGSLTYQVLGNYEVVGMGQPLDDFLAISGGPLGRQPGFDAGAASIAVFRDVPTAFRIDQAGDSGNSRSLGIQTAQLPPLLAGPDFRTDNPALVYRFQMVIGSGSVIHLTTPLEHVRGSPQAPEMAAAGIYTSSAASTIGLWDQELVLDGAVIDTWTPSPAGFIPIFVAAILRPRRGRG